MANADYWHHGATPLNHKGLKLPLMNDESFSSFILRCAHFNGCHPLDFTNYFSPHKRIWTLDLDREMDDSVLLQFSKITQISIPALSKTLICHYHPFSRYPMELPNGFWPWILATGKRGRKASQGFQFCPQCLAHSPSFFRLHWRFAWHTVCPTHKVLLHDHCPHCKLPTNFHNFYSHHCLINCSHCGKPLTDRSFESESILPTSFQMKVDSLVKSDVGLIESNILTQARFRIRLIRACIRQRSVKYRNFLDAISIAQDKTLFPSHQLQIEYMTSFERQTLLSRLWPALKIGNQKFDDILRSFNVSSAVIAPKDCREERTKNDELSIGHEGHFVPPSPKTMSHVMRKLALIKREINRRAQ